MNELPLNQILCGNCVEVLKDFPENSIDLVVTDPPYGLSFMGKDWDKALPSREAFTEIIRVLKPGALAFVMSSPRQDLLWRMLALLEGVGFELTQSYIDWIYKTGFPKAYDLGKGIDKKFGFKRKKIGRNPNYRSISGKIGYLGEHTFRQTDGMEYLDEPTSELAKKWDGWKSQTGLKPAHEPILMVNKPFSESTIVDNVLKWGTGAINVDVCRIPFQSEEDIGDPERFVDPNRGLFPPEKGWNQHSMKSTAKVGEKGGRFPANLLVSDGAIDREYEKRTGTKTVKIGRSPNLGRHGIYGNSGVVDGTNYNDSGYDSRYFDLDAWAEHHGFLDVPKPDNKERDYGLKGKKRIPTSKLNLSDGKNPVRLDGAISLPRRNVHPTVKPVKLMAYLIELGCPPDGVVLDPFVGSGTTCIAAKKLVRKYVGIEINPEYVALAQARIRAYPVPFDWFNESVAVPPKEVIK